MSYNRDSIWDQLLRIPLTEHVKRTIAYHTQDRVRPVGPGAVAAASPKPHTRHSGRRRNLSRRADISQR